MPAPEAEQVVEQLAGVKISAATLARQARQQGQRAEQERLWAEAMRHGLGRANEVLIVADGAAWIWNLAGDRFAGARRRVDFYQVSQHL